MASQLIFTCTAVLPVFAIKPKNLFPLVNSCPERSHLNNSIRCKLSTNGPWWHAQSSVLLLKLHHSLTSSRHHRALPAIPRDLHKYCRIGKRVWACHETAGFHNRMGKEYSLFLRADSSWSIHLATVVLEWTVHIKRCPALLAVSHGAATDH